MAQSIESKTNGSIQHENNYDQNSSFKFLIYGKTGWIGGMLGVLCEKQGIPYYYGKARIENRSQIIEDIKNINPTHIFNAAGVTGRPNACWCEFNKLETIRSNVIGALMVADVCKEWNLPLIHYASSCLFNYDDDHPLGSGIGFTEDDRPNYGGSFYSKTKAMVEDLLREYDNICILRVRMAVSSDLNNSRNMIYKITNYEKVVNIPNSLSNLDEVIPFSIEIAKRNLKGIWNLSNPGTITHNEILEMYKKYINPNFNWVNFSLEEQAKVLACPRCNNEMDASKLKKEFPQLLHIKDSLIKFVFEPNRKV